MDQKEISLEARLYALELFAANQLAISALSSGDPKRVIEAVRRQMAQGVQKLTLPQLNDPALSDLLASEIEDAVLLLVEMASGQIDHALASIQKKSGA